ncbi:hypothetical protein BE61_74530 [Bradyrhizobium elkanii USDA 61]|nr:hypothetical protein BE61_74530 [Bradyrhizobium elkanii USDA 61]
MLRRASDPQDPGISLTEQLSLLFQRIDAVEQQTAARNQLLAFASQQKPAPDTVEELQAELPFETDDLPGQSGLGDTQPQCGL